MVDFCVLNIREKNARVGSPLGSQDPSYRGVEPSRGQPLGIRIPLRKAKQLAFLFSLFFQRKKRKSGIPSRRARPVLPGRRFLAGATARNSNPSTKSQAVGFSFLLIFSEKKTERVGFEPTKRFHVYTLSKRAPSATRTSLQKKYQILHQESFRNKPCNI